MGDGIDILLLMFSVLLLLLSENDDPSCIESEFVANIVEVDAVELVEDDAVELVEVDAADASIDGMVSSTSSYKVQNLDKNHVLPAKSPLVDIHCSLLESNIHSLIA